MKQEDVNKAWEVVIPGKNGYPTIKVLCPPQEKDRGLKYPYTREAPLSKIMRMKRASKKFKKDYESSGKFQYCSIAVDRKTTGFKVRVFLLAYKVGLCGDSTGTTKEEWEKVTEKVKKLVCSLTGQEELMYIEPWNDNKKVQARWGKYVKVKC